MASHNLSDSLVPSSSARGFSARDWSIKRTFVVVLRACDSVPMVRLRPLRNSCQIIMDDLTVKVGPELVEVRLQDLGAPMQKSEAVLVLNHRARFSTPWRWLGRSYWHSRTKAAALAMWAAAP